MYQKDIDMIHWAQDWISLTVALHPFIMVLWACIIYSTINDKITRTKIIIMWSFIYFRFGRFPVHWQRTISVYGLLFGFAFLAILCFAGPLVRRMLSGLVRLSVMWDLHGLLMHKRLFSFDWMNIKNDEPSDMMIKQQSKSVRWYEWYA